MTKNSVKFLFVLVAIANVCSLTLIDPNPDKIAGSVQYCGACDK